MLFDTTIKPRVKSVLFFFVGLGLLVSGFHGALFSAPSPGQNANLLYFTEDLTPEEYAELKEKAKNSPAHVIMHYIMNIFLFFLGLAILFRNYLMRKYFDAYVDNQIGA